MYLKKEIPFGNTTLSIETGKMAKQAAGSVVMRAGDTMLLATVTSGVEPRLGDFMPLTVDFVSKMYAVGKIPGGYFKRETKPPESDVLIARLTDRPIRPLFPDGYSYETQIVVTVLSVGDENVYESLSIIGSSAALMFSHIPFQGPVAGAKVGRIDGKYILNPTLEQFEQSDIDITVAASLEAIVMVEGEAREVQEEVIVEALAFAHEALKPACQLQIEMMKELNVKKMESFEVLEYDENLIQDAKRFATEPLIKATLIKTKAERYNTYYQIKKDTLAYMAEKHSDVDFSAEVEKALEEIKRELIRGRIIHEDLRIDGRNTKQIRQITSEVRLLPRVHGSALFTRGETQGLVTVTLGAPRDLQRTETIDGDIETSFMLHYNFPPYSVGEAKPLRSPGRREIGHGNLALRGLKHVIPAYGNFPYTIRVVSEILESNGSSSMATVCGSTLALMDAGVPILKPVAGIAMGLIENGTDYYVLSDILGDMDFKVVGTKDGITSLQMDIKVKGLPEGVLSQALQQAKEGRVHILNEMAKAIAEPNKELSPFSPRFSELMVNPDKLGVLIGPSGKNIKKIIEETKADIEIKDSGSVRIFAPNLKSCQLAEQRVLDSVLELELNQIYEGTVSAIREIGAIIQLPGNNSALLHISEIAYERVNKVEDYLKLGEVIQVKLIQQRDGKNSVSLKALLPVPEGVTIEKEDKRPPKDDYKKDYDSKKGNGKPFNRKPR